MNTGKVVVRLTIARHVRSASAIIFGLQCDAPRSSCFMTISALFEITAHRRPLSTQYRFDFHTRLKLAKESFRSWPKAVLSL